MLIVFVWLGSMLPLRYIDTINECQSHPGNECIVLQEVHQKILHEKYKDLLHLSEARLKRLIMVERADIIRLLYLYDKGGIYSDLDNDINYTCLESFIKENKETFYFSNEQKWYRDSCNNFIYTSGPQNPEVKDVIQKIHLCEQCTDLNFASPYFMRRYNFTSKVIRKCVDHKYQSSWYWWKVKGLKSPEQAKAQAQGGPQHCQDEYQLTYISSYIVVILLVFAHVVRCWKGKQKQKQQSRVPVHNSWKGMNQNVSDDQIEDETARKGENFS